MRSTNWKGIAELVGIAAIVASLIFVGVQLRQEQQIAFAEKSQSSSATRTELDLAFAEHAEILVKSNAGIELTETEHGILVALIGAIWRITIIDFYEGQRLGEDSARFYTDYFAVFLYKNPGARTIWLDDSEEFNRYMDQLNPNASGLQPITTRVIESLNLLDDLNGSQ